MTDDELFQACFERMMAVGFMQTRTVEIIAIVAKEMRERIARSIETGAKDASGPIHGGWVAPMALARIERIPCEDFSLPRVRR